MSELREAISRGDLAEVERLLEQGASPLEVDEGQRSILRTAHDHLGDEAQRREVFLRVRRAAKDAIERDREQRPGLATPPREGPKGRGAQDLRRAVGANRALEVLCAECDVKVAARALAELVQSPRREADVASRPVADAKRGVFPYRLRGSAWTVLPLVFEARSPWNVAQVTELAARGDGIAPLARALAAAAGCRVLHVRYGEAAMYGPDGSVDRQPFEVEEWWAPEGDLPSQEEAETLLPDHAGDPAALREEAARVRERRRRIDEALEQLGAYLPAMRVETDGYHVQLALPGIDAASVERVDLVVLQELGDPAVDRRLGQAAPALAAPGGEAPLAHAPPAIVKEPEPANGAAPPARSEPAPIAEATASSEAVGSSPPPVVDARPMADNAPPPIVSEPVVRNDEPPPMVSAPVVENPVVEKDGDEPDPNERKTAGKPPPPVVSAPAAASPAVSEPVVHEPAASTAPSKEPPPPVVGEAVPNEPRPIAIEPADDGADP